VRPLPEERTSAIVGTVPGCLPVRPRNAHDEYIITRVRERDIYGPEEREAATLSPAAAAGQFADSRQHV